MLWLINSRLIEHRFDHPSDRDSGREQAGKNQAKETLKYSAFPVPGKDAWTQTMV
jgi:hypothetical protein